MAAVVEVSVRIPRRKSPARWSGLEKPAFWAISDHGASDTVKRQYWILQNLQKGKKERAYRLTYYRFTIPSDPNAPLKTVPRDIAIPIYE